MLPAAYRGINLHPIWYPTAKIDQLCSVLASSRVQQVRIDFPCNWLFPTKGTFHPGYLGRLTHFVSACPQNIEILGIIAYTPAWANGGLSYNIPWTNPLDITSAVTQLVSAFPTIPTWEAWNEPDLGYSWSYATGNVQQRAVAYTKFLETMGSAVRAANPAAKIAAPSTSGSGSSAWLGEFYSTNPHGLYDVISAHLYGDPPSHGNLAPAETVEAWASSIWPLIAANGDSATPLWLTESGWNTSSGGVSVDQQAAALTSLYQEVDRQIPAAKRLYWYEMLDDRSGSTSPNDYYGLLDVNLAQKGDGAAWAAFNALP